MRAKSAARSARTTRICVRTTKTCAKTARTVAKIVRSAASAAAAGDIELGLTQIPEILPYAGAELLGPLPKEIQIYTDFTLGVAANSRDAAAAAAWVRFLTSPSAAAVIKAKGLEPR